MEKYNKKKERNKEVSQYTHKHLREKSQERFCQCGSWIEFFADENLSKQKVHQANFCKNRFCPMCAWRTACKEAMKISVLMEYLEAEIGVAFIFVTLTAPNVSGKKLGQEITRYNEAFKRLTKRKAVSDINLGYVRKLEVTYNAKRNDYHTHFHCLFVVLKDYFVGRKYMAQARWLELWRDVMGDPSITQVDVRRVKRGGKDVNELAKYAAKDSHYTHSQAVFDVFYKALKGRQVITFNGVFSDANTKYKSGALDRYKTTDETEYIWIVLYRWFGKEYVEENRRKIDEEEYRQMKKDSVDEMAIG